MLASGKKLIPFGTRRAMRAVATLRTVCRNKCHVGAPSFWRQLYGHPRITVFGFNPPSPDDWILKWKICFVIVRWQKLIELNRKESSHILSKKWVRSCFKLTSITLSPRKNSKLKEDILKVKTSTEFYFQHRVSQRKKSNLFFSILSGCNLVPFC